MLGYEPFYGIWFMAAAFTTYIIRKPGVGIVAEMLAALLEVLMGNMYGPIVFVSGFIQGLGCAVGATVLSFIWTGVRSGYHTFAPGIVIAIFVIRLCSALIFTGVGCKLLADGLAKAGVLRGYAIGEEYTAIEIEE